MATTTYTLIARQTVGSGGASSVTFSSIPQNFTDLKLVYSARTDRSGYPTDLIKVAFNGVSTNQSSKRLEGDGSSASSASNSTFYAYVVDGSTATANTFGNGELYIPNYTSSNYKSGSSDGVSENNATTAYMGMSADLWSSTAAITSITLTLDVGPNFLEFSTFYLYGISNSSTQIASNIPYALGGDVIVNDGTYWYHAFLYSGTFTPIKNLTCDILVVAGGGGNGSGSAGYGGGGGGAGGFYSTTSQALTANTSYTATVGAGGSGFTNGSNSSFGSISGTIYGGGYGGSQLNSPSSGGSGGGGGNVITYYLGAAGTAGQGNSGGNGYYVANFAGGGGGGAGASGSNASSDHGGNGGNGSYNSLTDAIGAATGLGQSSGGHYYFAGGGGGGTYHGTPTATPGTGGLGGGAIGLNDNSTSASNGTANTGGGAGGGVNGITSNGGSGTIIIRYAI